MTRFSIPLVALLLVALTGWTADDPPRLVLTEASGLWVEGTSSLHDWRCDAPKVDGWLKADIGETLIGISNAEFTVQAAGLSCKNSTMDKKTHKALKADDYPTIHYKLTNAEVTSGAGNAVQVKATGQLTIAGQTRTVTTTVQGKLTADGQVRLTGALPITMSDFGIDPPTAMLGAMKTGDDVTVRFDIEVQTR